MVRTSPTLNLYVSVLAGTALVAEMVDAAASNPVAQACRFDSGRAHQFVGGNSGI